MNEIEHLRPWRYNHYFDDQIIIKADNQALAKNHDEYGKVVLEEILNKLIDKPETLRVLDMGCLEGHYSEILCDFGFREVVSIDLSESHIKRANLILKQIRKFDNSTIKQGDVLDSNFMESLGKFDLIFFHGLLYHLDSPIKIFNIIEKLINDKNNFYLLLGHQFKMNYGTMIQKMPIAELKFRSFNKDQTGFFVNPKDSSAYSGPSLRLNISALYQILLSFNYKELVAYDKIHSNMNSKRMNIQLILCKNNKPNFLKKLNSDSKFGKNYYYNWTGNEISNVKLNKNIFVITLIFFYRALGRISNALIK